MTWTCEAYDAELEAATGARCFFAEPGERACHTQAECTTAMAAERQRVHRQIRELAAHGDETSAFLAEEFTNPQQLLNGADDDPRR